MKRRNFMAGLLAPLLVLLPHRKQSNRAEKRLPLYTRYPDATRLARPEDVLTVMHDIGVNFSVRWLREEDGSQSIHVYRGLLQKIWGADAFAKQNHPLDVLVTATSWLMTTMTTEEGERFDKLLNSRLKLPEPHA